MFVRLSRSRTHTRTAQSSSARLLNVCGCVKVEKVVEKSIASEPLVQFQGDDASAAMSAVAAAPKPKAAPSADGQIDSRNIELVLAASTAGAGTLGVHGPEAAAHAAGARGLEGHAAGAAPA